MERKKEVQEQQGRGQLLAQRADRDQVRGRIHARDRDRGLVASQGLHIGEDLARDHTGEGLDLGQAHELQLSHAAPRSVDHVVHAAVVL